MANYWLARFNGQMAGQTRAAKNYACAVDSTGNVYTTGFVLTNANWDVYISKYSPTGVILWQRKMAIGSSDDVGGGIALDSSGNCYICGTTYGTPRKLFFCKYNSAGTKQWAYAIPASSVAEGNAIAGYSSLYYYCVGLNSDTTDQLSVLKIDTVGAVQWAKVLTGYTASSGYAAATDSSGNVYVGGQANNGTVTGTYVAKLDASGAMQWQKALFGASTAFLNGIALDSSNNVFAVGSAFISGSPQPCIIKYDSAGNLQWQRYLAGTGSGYFYGVAVDSSGIYAVGYKGSLSCIVKYDTSGNITWQRTFLTSGSNEARAVSIGPGTSIYVVGGADPIGYNFEAYTNKIPNDGSGTGVYGDWNAYGVSAFTNTTMTYTDTAGVGSIANNPNTAASVTTTINDLFYSYGVPV